MQPELQCITTEMGAILEAIAEPATLIGLDYRILATNSAYRQAYADDNPVSDRCCYEVSHGYNVPCDQAGESCPLKRCTETGLRQRLLHLHNTPNGEEHVDVDMQPVYNAEGDLVCFLEIMHCVREAKAVAGDEGGMVGRSDAFNTMLSLVHRAAPSEISVLLLGESGTGKELVARALHDSSVRAHKPFVTVECSGLSEALFESELFGHERGAFTGAVHRKRGLVEVARGGTLFLDEIGEIPLQQQVKLLRLIETGVFRSVGGLEPQHADVRLVCATHRNLKQMVEQGRFRQDLYYRISPFPIPLPTLKERIDDLPLLIEVLLRRLPGGTAVKVSKDALQAMRRYDFPGNIRELRNILERGILLADNGVIDIDQLSPEVLSVSEGAVVSGERPREVLPLEQVEAQYLRQVAARFKGDNRELAAKLGMSERTLYRKLRQLRVG
ncbi:Response regulator of zinc sigma-54-dependent two-component system [Marinobacterium lacunae]|uniref:Response regulator of zinc sigma-54-dependent two-component system n=1 Tax=Marinobacterium lacunae TaxID=1232683 RepID=A0A081FWE7_9GAMM|nr:sigma-54-dependent Fis family transcriptional regulator [Marinobacterium lacunae]KEA62852.1 Response regulator of zinc sigma-54-dependent two-component system [Marinobacterium lacunae]